MIELNSNLNIVVLVLLLVSLLFTLFRVKQRLFAIKPLRFYGVVALNVVVALVLAAWLTSFSIKVKPNELFVLNSEQKSDPSVALLKQPNLRALKVEGYGLRAEQWSAFDGIDIDHQAPSIHSGPVDMSWDRQLLLGNTVTVLGRYHHPSHHHSNKIGEIVTIKLLDPAGTLVSQVRVKADEHFKLTAIPKASGHYQYSINVVSEKGEILNQESLPIMVTEAPPAKLMVVQSAPSFESKHLKNWAAEQGASLLLLTTISKDKFITQSVNMADNQKRDFSPQLLKDIDLLVMDGRALVNLPVAKAQWLSEAVDNGLGLFVIADNAMIKAKQMPDILSGFALSPITTTQIGKPVTTPKWSGNHSELAFDYLPSMLSASNSKPLMSSRKKRTLSLYQTKGKGKVAVSILQGRYRWLLNGDIQTYSHYWQQLLSQLARVRSDSRFIHQSKTDMNLIGHRAKVCVLTDKPSLKLMTGTKTLNLSKDRFNPFRQCAFYWPQQAGWQRFVLFSGEYEGDRKSNVFGTTARYTFSPSQWQSWQQSIRVKDSSEFIIAQQQKSGKSSKASQDYQPVNPVLYWWLLVICGSLLWLESKVSLPASLQDKN